jgi:hypothetical protein
VWDKALGQVTTILDRTVPVQNGDFPAYCADSLFSIFRPTKVPGEMYGIGEPEAIEDLQEEINVFRQNRRDNALFALQRPFAYFRGMVEESDLAWGPGVGIPVDGDPKDLLFFPPMQDVPNSSYQDAEAFARDIERTTGVDDTGSGVAGTGGANATATGVMEVQRAAGLRIALKTLRFESEFVKEQARIWTEINQQKVGIGQDGADEPLFMHGPPKPGDEDGMAEGKSVYELGPATLAGEFDVEPIENSMSPQNTVERQQRGMQAYQTFGQDPYIEPVKLREFALENMGFDNPRGMIIVPQEQITPEEIAAAAQMIAPQLGIDPAVLTDMLAQGVAEAKAQEEAAVDNTTLDPGTGGDTVRDKDRAGVKTQIVGLDINAAGSEVLGTGDATNGLDVDVTRVQGTVTIAGAVTNAGTFATQDSEKVADNAGFTDGTTKVQPAGYIFDEVAGTALTENDAAAARIDSKRAQIGVIEDATTRGQRAAVSAANALKVDGSAVTQPISGRTRRASTSGRRRARSRSARRARTRRA